jgi:uncharacterized protein YbaA (DUF1428 family)
MTYVDGFLAAVPADKKAEYIDFNKRMGKVFKDHGALAVVDCWGDDVPQGKVTSMPMAVKCQEGEVVCFSWVTWASKAARVAGMGKAMEDPRMRDAKMPFDGQRLIFGGFEMVSSL